MSNLARARESPPIMMKGISREIFPYLLEGLVGETGEDTTVVSGATPRRELFFDIARIDPASAPQALALLQSAPDRLNTREPRR